MCVYVHLCVCIVLIVHTDQRRKNFIGNPTKSFAEEEAQESAPKVSMKSAIVKYFQKNEFLHKNKKLTTEKEDTEEVNIRQILRELEDAEEEETIQRNSHFNKRNRSRRISANWRKDNMMVDLMSSDSIHEKPSLTTRDAFSEKRDNISLSEDEDDNNGDVKDLNDCLRDEDHEFDNAFLDNE